MQFELRFGPERSTLPIEDWLRVGGRTLRLRLMRHRRARRYVLRLGVDGAARVTLPRGGSVAQARKFVQQNLAWLERQLLRQAAQPARPIAWLAGSEILFRGEHVRLEAQQCGDSLSSGGAVELRSSRRESALISPGFEWSPKCARSRFIGVRGCYEVDGNDLSGDSLPGGSGVQVIRFGSEVLKVAAGTADLRQAVERHLWRLAAKELPPRVFELAALHQLPARRVTVRNQRSRWGSCSRRGTISLNWRLVQAPPFVRDYIVLHELAHLKEMNHSHRFWREVERLCPDFDAAEKWLKQNSGLLR